MKRRWPLTVFKVAIFVTIAIAGFGQAVHQLWNWLMPTIFGLAAITFWQAVGLMGLSWLLFGGWRGFRGPGSRGNNRWRRRMLEHWDKMTPEERENFRAGIRKTCSSVFGENQAQRGV